MIKVDLKYVSHILKWEGNIFPFIEINHSDSTNSLHPPVKGRWAIINVLDPNKEFQHLFTLRSCCSTHHRGLIRFRISDRKFVNHTTEMILWSMILTFEGIKWYQTRLEIKYALKFNFTVQNVLFMLPTIHQVLEDVKHLFCHFNIKFSRVAKVTKNCVMSEPSLVKTWVLGRCGVAGGGPTWCAVSAMFLHSSTDYNLVQCRHVPGRNSHGVWYGPKFINPILDGLLY